MRKKRTIIPALLIMCALMTGCSFGDRSTSSGASSTPSASTPAAESKPTASVSADSSSTSTEEKPDFEVKIEKILLSKDYKNEDVLVIDYTFTNNSDKEAAFIYTFRNSVYQDGVECNDTVISCDDLDTTNTMNKVQPGITYTVQWGYHIDPTKPCQVKVTDLPGKVTYIDETIEKYE